MRTPETSVTELVTGAATAICDCASVKTTLRRVMQDFPLEPMLESTA